MASEPIGRGFSDTRRVLPSSRRQAEQASQQRWFFNPRHQQNVAGDARFDERFIHIAPPRFGFDNQLLCFRIASVKIKVSKSQSNIPHFRERPMWRGNLFKTPGKALSKVLT
jgi:hypothetical protein